jgi:excisionase family DNA binding protein
MARFGLTVREASEETGYNPEYLRRLIRQRKIEAELIGQVYFIKPDSLRFYVEKMIQREDARAGPRQ